MVGTADGSFEALIALLAGRQGRSRPHRVRPLIAVPTTAGTGSEVTPWATIWDRAAPAEVFAAPSRDLARSRRWSIPELTLSLPAGPTLAAGLDALSHALESIWNVNANPVSDTHAVAAARTVIATLPALMRRPRQPGAAPPPCAGRAAGRTRVFQHQDRAGALDLVRHDAAARTAARHRLLVHAADGAGARDRHGRLLAMPCSRASSTARWPTPRTPSPRFSKRLGVSTRFESLRRLRAPEPPGMVERRARRRSRPQFHRRGPRRRATFDEHAAS